MLVVGGHEVLGFRFCRLLVQVREETWLILRRFLMIIFMVFSIVFHFSLVHLVFHHDTQAHELVVEGLELLISLFLFVLEALDLFC